MKYLFLLMTFITMLANLLITLQAVKLKAKIKRVEKIERQDMITFYLPQKTKTNHSEGAASQCPDTVLLEQEVLL